MGSECKKTFGFFSILFSSMFLVAWLIACIIILIDTSSNYYWSQNSVATTVYVEGNWTSNTSYRDNCDPRCINGCAYCIFPCYNGGVDYEYFDKNNKSYIFRETIYNCVRSYQDLVRKLDTCCSVGRASPLWYNNSNPKDYRKTNDPGHFMDWVIAFPMVTIAAVVMIVLASRIGCHSNGDC